MGIPESGYSRGTARLVATGLRGDLTRRNEGMGRRHAVDPVELRFFLEALRDGSYSPDDDVVLVAHLVLSGGGWSLFERNRAAIVGAVEQTQWVDPWARHYLSGLRRVHDAWDARGNAFADKVKPEGWKGFSESLALARQDLEASWRARPDRPEAATKMIEVAMAEGLPGETPRLWFDRAVAARMDFMDAYRHMITALRSRWGGTEGELLAFARECAATRRFDTEVPFQAFNAVEWLEQRHPWRGAPAKRNGRCSPPACGLALTRADDVRRGRGGTRTLSPGTRPGARGRRVALQAAIAYKAGRTRGRVRSSTRSAACSTPRDRLRARGYGRGADRGACRPGRRGFAAPRGSG